MRVELRFKPLAAEAVLPLFGAGSPDQDQVVADSVAVVIVPIIEERMQLSLSVGYVELLQE